MVIGRVIFILDYFAWQMKQREAGIMDDAYFRGFTCCYIVFIFIVNIAETSPPLLISLILPSFDFVSAATAPYATRNRWYFLRSIWFISSTSKSVSLKTCELLLYEFGRFTDCVVILRKDFSNTAWTDIVHNSHPAKLRETGAYYLYTKPPIIAHILTACANRYEVP